MAETPFPASPDPRLHILKQLAASYKVSCSAAAASIVSTTVGFPFDSVKTRVSLYKFTSVWHCIKETRRMEGIRGFFRGIWVPLCSITAVRTCSFSIYANTKDRYREILAPNVPPPHVSQFTNTVAATLAGLTSGAVISVISCPFEFTKLAMQIEYLLAKAKYSSAPDFPSYPEITPKGSLETAKEIVRNRGLLGLYSGFPYHLLRDAAGTGLYFTFYESFKWALTPHDGDAGTLTFALSGGLCGVFSWLLVFPIDTYKSIRQRDILTNPPGVLITRTRPLNYKSLRRMYRGVGVSVIRSCIVNAINFTVFENMKKCIDRWSSDE